MTSKEHSWLLVAEVLNKVTARCLANKVVAHGWRRFVVEGEKNCVMRIMKPAVPGKYIVVSFTIGLFNGVVKNSALH